MVRSSEDEREALALGEATGRSLAQLNRHAVTLHGT